MIDYEWFVEHLKRLSRQRIKTLVKPIGLTPRSKDGRWSFLDKFGREVELPVVLSALMSASESRAFNALARIGELTWK